MIIYIYNNFFNRIERYSLELYDPMPYTTNNSLSVKEFRSSSRSLVLWTTVAAMQAWNLFSRSNCKHYVPFHAFRRICEGGHPPQSQHYAGTAFDLQSSSITTSNPDFSLEKTSFNTLHLCNSASYGYPALKLGDIGVYVMVLQDALYTIGISPGALDGFFGYLTQSALCSFQSKFMISPSGQADAETWRKLSFQASGAGNSNKIPYLLQ